MIYGLLAKQTPTEAREHPQLPHWDASWAHLQQVTRSRCPEVGLGNPDSTSERSQKVKSRKRKPTSGHQERPAKVVDRKKRRRQKEDANNVFEHIQTMQIHCVFVGFKHIATFEAISANTTVNGTGARSTFHKFT